MVDDVNVTAGSGTAIATDDVGGRHFQRVKVTHGADGTATDVSAASPLEVSDQDKVADNAAFTDGTTKVLPAGYVFDEVAGTALTENDAAAARIDAKRAQVISIEDATTRGQKLGITAGGAAKTDGSATTQPVSIASAVPVTDNSGTLTVDAPVGTPVFTRLSDGTTALTTTAGRLSVDGSGVTQPISLAAGATAIGKAEDVASADGDVGVAVMAVRRASPANSSGTDGDYEPLQMSAGRLWASAVLEAGAALIGDVNSRGFETTVSVDITRPADTNVYAINDALSDSTSAPTAGGFTFTGVARASGKGAFIVGAIITSSVPASTLVGEVVLFDSAVTAINDNAAFVVSDAEAKTIVAKIPFTMEDMGNNSMAQVDVNRLVTTVGSANLRGLVRVKSAYTPASAEVITIRLQILQVD